MDALLVLLGIVFAVYGAEFLVDGGTAIAKRFGIPQLVIGSTIVAFGTSMPEFTVNMNSAFAGNADLALGNILGSNLFNVCMILGVVAVMAPIAVGPDAAFKDLPMCLLSAVLLGVCGNELYFDHIDYHELMRSDGIMFLAFFAVFMSYVYREAATGRSHHHKAKAYGTREKLSASGAEDGDKVMPVSKATLWIVVGLLGLVFGGEFVVDGATGVAKSFGISQRVIGLVIVGPGTSLPELMASIVAARKKNAGMVIGNVLGSCIFNVFFTLGATALILPVPLDLALNSVIVINASVTALLVAYVWMSRSRQIGRTMGVILLAVYVGYLVWALKS